MGYSWPVRKVAGAMTVTLVVDDEGIEGIRKMVDYLKTSLVCWNVKKQLKNRLEFKTVLKTSKMELSFDHEVHETGLTSSEKLTVSPITLVDMTMKQTTHFEGTFLEI